MADITVDMEGSIIKGDGTEGPEHSIAREDAANTIAALFVVVGAST